MSLVRMTHPRIGEREVRAKAVPKMQQNGWTVADDPPKRKRRSKPDTDDEPSEKDSGGSFSPENEEES